ncbi:MAG TPA: hypothetical protein VIY52_33955 [Streptosporangiaceae bacterium]
MRLTYPAPMRSSSRIRCTHALNERQVREGPGEVPKVPAAVRFYLLGVQQQRAGVGRQLLAQRRGGARLPDLGERRDHRSRPSEKLRQAALEAINGTG